MPESYLIDSSVLYLPHIHEHKNVEVPGILTESDNNRKVCGKTELGK